MINSFHTRPCKKIISRKCIAILFSLNHTEWKNEKILLYSNNSLKRSQVLEIRILNNYNIYIYI